MYFFKFRHRISELRRPIAVKLCHVINIWLSFIMQVQKFGGPRLKNLGPKHAKFGSIVHNFRLWSRMSPERDKISKIGKTCDRERLLSRSAKYVRWTLVHYPESWTCSLDPPKWPKSTFSGGVRLSRRQAISATVKSATNQLADNQLGDTSRSTRRQLIFKFSTPGQDIDN